MRKQEKKKKRNFQLNDDSSLIIMRINDIVNSICDV